MVIRRLTLALAIGFWMGGMVAAQEVRGKVAKVEPDNKTLVLEGRGKGLRGQMLSFTLTKNTQITVGGEPGQMADLTPGTRVRVQFQIKGDQRVATGVAVSALSTLLRQPPEAAAPSAAPSTDANTVTGLLRRVGVSDREITVLAPGPQGQAEVTLGVPAKTPIMRDQKAIQLADLKEGEQVTVRPEKRDGRLVAASLTIGAGLPPPPATSSRIERLRQFLRMADQFLEQIEKQNEPKP